MPSISVLRTAIRSSCVWRSRVSHALHAVASPSLRRQTGAGKTFTMAGVPGMLGVTPRTINELYEVIEKGKSRFNYTVMGSMLELYRQDLVDLLAKGDPAAAKQKLNVRIEKSGMVNIEHL